MSSSSEDVSVDWTAFRRFATSITRKVLQLWSLMHKLAEWSLNPSAIAPPSMRSPRSLYSSAAVAALLCFISSSVPLEAAEAKEVVLIDFTYSTRDPDGTVSRSYEYAFGDWQKHLVDLKGKGTLIKAPSGKGGIGENKTLVDFGKSSAVNLQLIIGNANSSGGISLSIEDRDGTEQSWNISLEGKPRGQPLRFPLDLTKSSSESKPGKTPGLNLKKVAVWQMKGNWTDPNVEVLLVKLTASK